MKKYFALIMTLLFVFVLVGCGDRREPSQTGDKKTIYVDGGGDIGNYNTTALMSASEANPFPYNTLEKLCEEWEALNPSYDVVVNKTSSGGDRGVLVPQLNEKTAADIVYQSYTVLNTDLGKGYYVDLTDALNSKNKYATDYDKWIDIYDGEKVVASDGRHYTIELERIPVGIMYNKEIFTELGIAVPSTFDQFIAACQKIKESKYEAYSTTYTWYDIVLESNIFSSLLDEVDILRPDGKVDTEELCRAYTKGLYEPSTAQDNAYYQYIKMCKTKTEYYPENWQTYDAISNFALGNLAMIEATGKEMRKLSVNQNIDFEWAVMPFPDLTTESTAVASTPVIRGSAGLATSWFVTNSAEEKGTVDGCIDLLMYLTAPQNNNRLVGDLKGGIPLNPTSDYELASYIEPLIEIYNADMDAFSRGERVRWASFCSWEVLGYDFNTTFIRTLQDVDNGIKTVDQAVNSLVSAIRNNVQAQRILNTWDETAW